MNLDQLLYVDLILECWQWRLEFAPYKLVRIGGYINIIQQMYNKEFLKYERLKG